MCSGWGDIHGAVPVAPYFNGVFPAASPDDSTWTTENAFRNLTFVDPMWVEQIPGTNELMVIEKPGVVRRFPNDPAVTPDQVQVVLDLSSSVQASEDQGFYRIAFHPEFGLAGSTHVNEVFATYNHRPNSPDASPDKSMWRLSRFLWQPATGTIDPASESVLIQQFDPHRWHNGGALAFDGDGFLLVSCGDGGSANDQLALSQRLNAGFFGGILRIDVDNDPARSHPIRRQPLSHSSRPASFPVSFSQGYGIPNDNPWLSTTGTLLEEFHAIGLRSPHAMHIDPATSDLWVGDVGQNAAEELNLVRKGGNCQWPYQEGNSSGPKLKSSFTETGIETPPVWSYDRTQGGCIIAGMIYRGSKWAEELGGKLIYGDNIKGSLHAFHPAPPEGPPFVSNLLSGFGPGIYSGLSNICTDPDGEIYLLKLNGTGQPGGTIRKLAVAAGDAAQPPALLSATGLFTDTALLEPSPALIPFEVASPLWSDGAVKRRWLAIPNDGNRNSTTERIDFSIGGNWSFPAGSVFVKHFEMPLDARDPSQVKRLETRVIVCTASGGKYGLTYRWNEEGTDAALLPDGAEESFPVTGEDGASDVVTWTYPSRADCMQCHTNAAGQSLGLRTHQLNLDVRRPVTGEWVNQLVHFSNESLLNSGFSMSTSDAEGFLRARGLDDDAAPLEHRIRSYLDSNCSHCHQPGGVVPHFDARLQTPLKNQRMMNEIIRGQFHLPGGCYLKPGDASLSAVHVRMAGSDPGIAMPPLARHRVDTAAVARLQEYLLGLTEEEFETDPIPSARYVRFTVNQVAGGATAAVAELSVLDGEGGKIPHSEVSVSSVTSELEPGNSMRVIDGDPWTSWISTASGGFPKSLTLDLGTSRPIGGIEYVPRQDSSAGRPRSYQVHYGDDGTTWTLMTSKSVLSPTSATDNYTGLLGRRPVRVSLAGPAETPAKVFKVTIVFDAAVTDFVASDLVVTGGAVTFLRGGGYHYVATISASQPEVIVSLPANRVNTATHGNPASDALVIQSGLLSPPVPAFTALPDHYFGPFEARLEFDQPCSGLTMEDFNVTGGTLEWLIPDGDAWRLIVVPDQIQVFVTLREGAVTGINGLQMGSRIQFGIARQAPNMAMEAESAWRFGFTYVESASASNGGYVWVVKGGRAGVTTPDTSFRIFSSSISVPYAGNYRLRAWTRADDLASDSFHIRIGATGSEPILPWRINQGPGQVGSGQFHAGFAKNAGPDHVFALPAGSNTIEIFAAEDGTRIDRFTLIPERPFGLWTGVAVSSSLSRSAVLRFTSPVTGLSAEDFETMGGSVTGVSGSGQEYIVTLHASAGKMVARLRENAVTDEFGALSIPSEWFYTKWLDTYGQWTAERGLNAQPAADQSDADGDGIGQWMEYAFGLDPSVPDAWRIDPADGTLRGLPRVEVEPVASGHRLTIIFDRRRAGSPLSYAAEFTSDFLDFSRQTDFTGQVEIIDDQWERIIVHDAAATGLEPSRFGRVVVERDE